MMRPGPGCDTRATNGFLKSRTNSVLDQLPAAPAAHYFQHATPESCSWYTEVNSLDNRVNRLIVVTQYWNEDLQLENTNIFSRLYISVIVIRERPSNLCWVSITGNSQPTLICTSAFAIYPCRHMIKTRQVHTGPRSSKSNLLTEVGSLSLGHISIQ